MLLLGGGGEKEEAWKWEAFVGYGMSARTWHTPGTHPEPIWPNPLLCTHTMRCLIIVI
jgi:hypothetical protein